MVEGVLSHQMKQFVIDANKCVLNRPSSEARVEDGEFEENEVYAVDIVVSTGEGKTRVRSMSPQRSFCCMHRSVEVQAHARTCLQPSTIECAVHADRSGWHVQVLDEKETAVYKRALEEQYKLKMKASRCAMPGQLEMSRTNLQPLHVTSCSSFPVWPCGPPAVKAQVDHVGGAPRAALWYLLTVVS
jgi:methionine aminopeptidase